MSRGKKKQLKHLIESLPEECFWVNNGPILSDLRELQEALISMNEKQFSHHVHGKYNDFADWVEKSLGDKACSQEMRKKRKKETMAKSVGDCLKRYTI